MLKVEGQKNVLVLALQGLGLVELQEGLGLGLILDQKLNVSVLEAKVSFTSLLCT